jgi:hypothetical protein
MPPKEFHLDPLLSPARFRKRLRHAWQGVAGSRSTRDAGNFRLREFIRTTEF